MIESASIRLSLERTYLKYAMLVFVLKERWTLSPYTIALTKYDVVAYLASMR